MTKHIAPWAPDPHTPHLPHLGVSLGALLLPLLLTGGTGCLDASDDPAAGEVASASSAIVNGTAVAPANTGHVWLGNCSGELLRNRWVLTPPPT
jgi:hypothetical protein